MGAKKLFAVELIYTALVWAENGEEAFEIASDERREIISDSPDPDIQVGHAGVQLHQLGLYGWDERCFPYGDDGSKTIGELLREAPTEEAPTAAELEALGQQR